MGFMRTGALVQDASEDGRGELIGGRYADRRFSDDVFKCGNRERFGRPVQTAEPCGVQDSRDRIQHRLFTDSGFGKATDVGSER